MLIKQTGEKNNQPEKVKKGRKTEKVGQITEQIVLYPKISIITLNVNDQKDQFQRQNSRYMMFTRDTFKT